MSKGLLILLVLGAVMAGSSPAPAQEQQGPRLVPPRAQRGVVQSGQQLADLRRRVLELDRLIGLGSVARAESLLEDLEQHSLLKDELVSRRIKLAQLRDDHRQAVDLSREAVISQPLNAALWRSLTSSLLAVAEPDSAREAAGMFIATSPNARSAGMVAVELFQMAHRPRVSLGLIDSLRITLAEPRYLGRQRAVCLLQLGEPEESADEVVAELRYNPFNISLLRTDLLEEAYQPGRHQDFLDRLKERAAESGSRTAESVLLANLYLADGQAAPALAVIAPRFETRSSLITVLQNGVSLSQELELLEDPAQRQATVDYLLDTMARMCGPVNPDQALRLRAADYLARVCEQGLEMGALGGDPHQAVQRYGEYLQLVRQVHPASQYLYSSQIKLAAYTRDELRQPRQAAGRLERMLLDLDLPTEGVALVRLTLGECYLAAGDTARGRTVLTQLGRDPDFREAAGHAHFHLARLDLAEGHFATARDRFAVAAMDNPAAPYANDSLELGLAIAEEMDNPSGGPAILQLYGQSVYFDLTRRPEDQLAALEHFVAQADLRLDPEDKQHLLERGRRELAEAYQKAGRIEDALAQWNAIVLNHPDGRHPALALLARAQLFARTGRPEESRQAMEQLLAQYPDYLFVEDVRDELRNLP